MFQFKQFTICQETTPMKVGTDGVLLGAWADLENAVHILDIGTGTGLIALMAAQRNLQAHIDALEIEINAIKQAGENIKASSWAERIKLYPEALQDYIPAFGYDCIVCNPPYFVSSTLAPDEGRSLARHCNTLSHIELIIHASRLLKQEGNFCVILPSPEARQLIATARNYQLYPRRITYIIPNPGKAPKRYLIEFVKYDTSCLENELVVEISRHKYTPEYIALTKDFYLKF